VGKLVSNAAKNDSERASGCPEGAGKFCILCKTFLKGLKVSSVVTSRAMVPMGEFERYANSLHAFGGTTAGQATIRAHD
jgi:hypothetical protein